MRQQYAPGLEASNGPASYCFSDPWIPFALPAAARLPEQQPGCFGRGEGWGGSCSVITSIPGSLLPTPTQAPAHPGVEVVIPWEWLGVAGEIDFHFALGPANDGALTTRVPGEPMGWCLGHPG